MLTITDFFLNQKNIEKSQKHYAHFDCRTNIQKSKKYITDPNWVAHHGFYPFIHYEKDCTKYGKNGKMEKKRDICYASHIDRCILQYYCHVLNESYNLMLLENGILNVPIAYRTDLKMNNIHFAKQAFDFIKSNPDCYVLIGDFTGFFDNLDHIYLKQQWCKLLKVDLLPPDHYNIFKNITKYSTWELNDILALNSLPTTRFGRKKLDTQRTVLTKDQFKRYRSHIHKNNNNFGIPQGSPISALLANIYMTDADCKINSIVSNHSGKYMRYSDDFIIILPIDEADSYSVIHSILQTIQSIPRLELEPQKTQIYKAELPQICNVGKLFLQNADLSKATINFLGFTFDGQKVNIRNKTISKYYYRMYRKARSVAKHPSMKNKKCLYEKYSRKGAKPSGNHRGNFITYVHRSEYIFNDHEEIRRPIKRHMDKINKVLKGPRL